MASLREILSRPMWSGLPTGGKTQVRPGSRPTRWKEKWRARKLILTSLQESDRSNRDQDLIGIDAHGQISQRPFAWEEEGFRPIALGKGF
jgi:hypothetical protein